MRITLNLVNRALKAAAINAELVRGQGYFYFQGPSIDTTKEQGVHGVYRLGELTLERWVEEAQERTATKHFERSTTQ